MLRILDINARYINANNANYVNLPYYAYTR